MGAFGSLTERHTLPQILAGAKAGHTRAFRHVSLVQINSPDPLQGQSLPLQGDVAICLSIPLRNYNWSKELKMYDPAQTLTETIFSWMLYSPSVSQSLWTATTI